MKDISLSKTKNIDLRDTSMERIKAIKQEALKNPI